MLIKSHVELSSPYTRWDLYTRLFMGYPTHLLLLQQLPLRCACR